jgi:HEAT repeat protein
MTHNTIQNTTHIFASDSFHLVTLLADPDVSRRSEAASALQAMGDAALEPLHAALRHENKQVRWRAASLLSSLQNTVWLDTALVKTLCRQDDLVASVVVDSLAKLGTVAIPTLLALLPEVSPVVQLRVIVALGTLQDEQAIPPLCELLQHTHSPSIRYTIIQALEKIGDPRVIQLIQPFEHDEDRHVRKYAQHALETLRNRL